VSDNDCDCYDCTMEKEIERLTADRDRLQIALDEALNHVRVGSIVSSWSDTLSTQLVNDIIHEREQARAELEKYKKAVAEQLRFDMASVLTGTPEERLRLEADRMRPIVEAAKAFKNEHPYDTSRWTESAKAMQIQKVFDKRDKLFAAIDAAEAGRGK